MKKIIFCIILLGISHNILAADKVILNWKDCLNEAIKNNPGLAASKQEVNQYKAEKRVATSPMLPQISASSKLERTNTFSGGENRDSFTYSVKGEQLLFDGFKTYNKAKSAGQGLRASEYDYILVSSEVRYNLKKAFFELLKIQTLVPIMNNIISRRKQNLDMIKLKYESGREHEGSLLLAEADLAQAQYEYRKAKRGLSVAQYALKEALGWQNDVPINVKGDFVLSISIENKMDFSFLADNHPLIKKKEFEKASAKYDVNAAKADFFPELKFNAEAGKMRTNSFTDEKEWTVGFNMSLPLFEGGQRIFETQKAKAKLMQVDLDKKSEYYNIISTLEKTWQALQDAKEEVEVQSKYLKAAKARAKIAAAEYSNGLLIFDNWIVIENNYINIQKSYVEAEASMLIAEAAWIKAKGGGLDYE